MWIPNAYVYWSHDITAAFRGRFFVPKSETLAMLLFGAIIVIAFLAYLFMRAPSRPVEPPKPVASETHLRDANGRFLKRK